MKSLCDRTGGYMVMGDSFSMHVFKKFDKIGWLWNQKEQILMPKCTILV
jgi:hypothetical protein